MSAPKRPAGIEFPAAALLQRQSGSKLRVGNEASVFLDAVMKSLTSSILTAATQAASTVDGTRRMLSGGEESDVSITRGGTRIDVKHLQMAIAGDDTLRHLLEMVRAPQSGDPDADEPRADSESDESNDSQSDSESADSTLSEDVAESQPSRNSEMASPARKRARFDLPDAEYPHIQSWLLDTLRTQYQEPKVLEVDGLPFVGKTSVTQFISRHLSSASFELKCPIDLLSKISPLSVSFPLPSADLLIQVPLALPCSSFSERLDTDLQHHFYTNPSEDGAGFLHHVAASISAARLQACSSVCACTVCADKPARSKIGVVDRSRCSLTAMALQLFAHQGINTSQLHTFLMYLDRAFPNSTSEPNWLVYLDSEPQEVRARLLTSLSNRSDSQSPLSSSFFEGLDRSMFDAVLDRLVGDQRVFVVNVPPGKLESDAPDAAARTRRSARHCVNSVSESSAACDARVAHQLMRRMLLVFGGFAAPARLVFARTEWTSHPKSGHAVPSALALAEFEGRLVARVYERLADVVSGFKSLAREDQADEPDDTAFTIRPSDAECRSWLDARLGGEVQRFSDRNQVIMIHHSVWMQPPTLFPRLLMLHLAHLHHVIVYANAGEVPSCPVWFSRESSSRQSL